jgi:hypothetical protein
MCNGYRGSHTSCNKQSAESTGLNRKSKQKGNHTRGKIVNLLRNICGSEPLFVMTIFAYLVTEVTTHYYRSNASRKSAT